MPQNSPTVFVVAATGTQGSALCRRLRELGWGVRATVRNPDSRQAQALANIGVELNAGDWDDEAPLAAGVAGCDMLFLALVASYRNMDNERIWALRILRVARAAGVKQVVYTSVVSADAPERRTLLPADHLLCKGLFSKNVIEGLVQRAGFEHWTILRPGFFMSNLLDPKARMYYELFERDTWLTAMTPDTKLGLIDPEDIAKFAVAAFQDPKRFDKQAIELVGERLTPEQMMALLSGVVGREMKASFYTEEEIRTGITTNPLIGAQLVLRDGEKYADMERVKSWGIPMGTFKDFLEREKIAVRETYD
ncbi:Nad h azoreductase [Pleurostoma richardsiae]|uniref:Nad h azoreductase n=1 Tax=Pleurostoma richardsiae TaxID=41990 RepID=A0AA38R1F3_9PEZI|nr:Nad h azoreductase [Pleurostoma richardsiae]